MLLLIVLSFRFSDRDKVYYPVCKRREVVAWKGDWSSNVGRRVAYFSCLGIDNVVSFIEDVDQSWIFIKEGACQRIHINHILNVSSLFQPCPDRLQVADINGMATSAKVRSVANHTDDGPEKLLPMNDSDSILDFGSEKP